MTTPSEKFLKLLARTQGAGIKSALFTALLATLVACAGSPALNESLDADGVPVWVNEGSNILTSSKEGRRFYGVGSAPMLGDFSLQTATADNRAKAEVVRILASYMEIVSRDFIASGDAEEAGFTEQSVAQQINGLAKINLNGAQVIGHWQDKQTDVIYSIAELNLEHVRKKLEQSENLNKGLREYIGRKGGTIFDRIAKSED